jgi:hypothetical protein
VKNNNRAQVSYHRAKNIANNSLRVYKTTPKIATREDKLRINEEIIAPNFKPQKPMIFAKLDQRAFESNDQFLQRLETKA